MPDNTHQDDLTSLRSQLVHLTISQDTASNEQSNYSDHPSRLSSADQRGLLGDGNWRTLARKSYKKFRKNGGYTMSERDKTLGRWVWSLAYGDKDLEAQIGERVLRPYFTALHDGSFGDDLDNPDSLDVQIDEGKQWLRTMIKSQAADELTIEFQEDFSSAVFYLWDARVTVDSVEGDIEEEEADVLNLLMRSHEELQDDLSKVNADDFERDQMMQMADVSDMQQCIVALTEENRGLRREITNLSASLADSVSEVKQESMKTEMMKFVATTRPQDRLGLLALLRQMVREQENRRH